MKVKQEVWMMASLAEVDDVAGAARYAGKYLHMSKRVHDEIILSELMKMEGLS